MGLETISCRVPQLSYRVPELWNLFPTEIKVVLSLSIFKEKIDL